MLLAAGLGSRYGGVKPLAPVGPDGQPLLAIALRQAADAGFDRAVVVVGEQTEQPIRHALGAPPLPVSFRLQGRIGPARLKPWGTTAAVLSAVGHSDLVIANGDDLYGVEGLAAARDWITSASGADGAAVLYEAGRTISSRGGVSRAVPTITDGRLVGLVEERDVCRGPDGVIRTTDGRGLAEEQPVSMNLWCLRLTAIEALQVSFRLFVARNADDVDAELGLSTAIGELLGALRVDALVTRSPWHGVTFASDVADVRAALRDAD